jgi:hypothetical protein
MADLSKLTGKFGGDFQKLMDNVKSMINPGPVPEIAKDDPIGYRLAKVVEAVKIITDNHSKQGEEIAKLNAMLGEMAKEFAMLKACDKKEEVTAKVTAKDKEKEKAK